MFTDVLMRFCRGQNILVQVKQEGIGRGTMGAVLEQYGNCTTAVHLRVPKEDILM